MSNFIKIRRRSRCSDQNTGCKSEVRIAVGAKDVFFFKMTRPALGPTQAAIRGEDRKYFSILYGIQGHVSYVTKIHTGSK